MVYTLDMTSSLRKMNNYNNHNNNMKLGKKKNTVGMSTEIEDRKSQQQPRLELELEYSPPPKSLSVFVLFLDEDDKPLPWYHIKPFEDNSFPLCRVTPHLSPSYFDFFNDAGFSLVACGTKIYSFGGCDYDAGIGVMTVRGRKDVWVYETNGSVPPIWERHSSMPQPRYRPVCVAVDDKIYVFGSNLRNVSIPQPWAEVFHTNSGDWKPISEPPRLFVEEKTITGTAVYGDQILMEVGRKVYSYNITQDSWVDITTDYPNFPRLYGGTAVIDDVLYTYDCQEIIAYDLRNNKSCYVEGLDEIMSSAALRGAVYDCGKRRLCVVWSIPVRLAVINYLLCATFEVFREDSEHGKHKIRADNISSRYYTVQGTIMFHCIAL